MGIEMRWVLHFLEVAIVVLMVSGLILMHFPFWGLERWAGRILLSAFALVLLRLSVLAFGD
jgi:hypothetical protein